MMNASARNRLTSTRLMRFLRSVLFKRVLEELTELPVTSMAVSRMLFEVTILLLLHIVQQVGLDNSRDGHPNVPELHLVLLHYGDWNLRTEQ